jgi:hypothetical protein
MLVSTWRIGPFMLKDSHSLHIFVPGRNIAFRGVKLLSWKSSSKIRDFLIVFGGGEKPSKPS